jgi:spore germination protein
MGVKLFKRLFSNDISKQYSLFPDLKLVQNKIVDESNLTLAESIDLTSNNQQLEMNFYNPVIVDPEHLQDLIELAPKVGRANIVKRMFFYLFPLSKALNLDIPANDSTTSNALSDISLPTDQIEEFEVQILDSEMIDSLNLDFKYSNFALGFIQKTLNLIEFLTIITTNLKLKLNNIKPSNFRLPLRAISLPLAIVLGFTYSSNYILPKKPTTPSLEYLSNPYSNSQAATFFGKEFSALGKALSSSQGNTLSLANFSTPKSPIKVSAWLPWWSWTNGLDSSLANQGSLGDISAFLFTLKNDGSIVYKSDIQNLSNAINRVHAAGYKIEAAISEEPNASEILTMFQTKDSRTKLIDAIIEATILFDGVDIDFEALQFSSSESDKAKIRILYPVFLIELRERLHSKGKTLSVSVGARTSVTDPNWNVFDYQSLGLVADKVKIMAYDLHNSKSNPGPVSSKVWINNILNYALSVVSPEKISVGLPSYAYLYSSDGKVKVVTGNSFESFIQKHPGNQVRDPESELMYLTFESSGVKYDFYYPDAQFFKSVSTMLKERNITSVAIWSVGNEAKDIWDSLK